MVNYLRPAAAALVVLAALLLFSPAPVARAQGVPEPTEQELFPAGLVAGDWFGVSTAVDGEWAFIGAVMHNGDLGRVDVYKREGGFWSHDDTITPPAGAGWFGQDIAVRGDTLIVGAQQAVGGGSVHVYKLTSGIWTYDQDLAPPGETTQFGWSVALDGDVAVVGAIREGTAGAAHVYRRQSGTFAFEQTLTPAGLISGAQFGTSVAVEGSTIVVGARRQAGDTGAAYVFDHDGQTWSETTSLARPTPFGDEDFGESVAIEGNVIVVGAYGVDRGQDKNAGAAYVFRKNGTWQHEQELLASVVKGAANFGWRCEIEAGLVYVSAVTDVGTGFTEGALYVFSHDGTQWVEERFVSPKSAAPGGWFGSGLDVDGTTAIVGARFTHVEGERAGLAYALEFKSIRKPLFIIPGIAGTYASDAQDDLGWLLNRGIDPQYIQIDPIGNVYDDLVKTLENVGYVRDDTLFLVDYDWRMPPGPSDGQIDGVISGLTADSITNTTFSYAVDYFGREMRRALELWQTNHPGETLDEIDVICHSTGGLVARTYLQCAAYGQSITGTNLELPEIDNLIMLAVPNRGASKAWNPLHDNWIADHIYIAVLSKICARAWDKVLAGGEITGPTPQDGIDLASITVGGPPDPVTFIHRYTPTIRGLLATYDFLDSGNGLENVNSDPAVRNDLVLDLNNGMGLGNFTNNFPFADRCRPSVFYATGIDTVTWVERRTGPAAFVIARFTDFIPTDAGNGETWYKDLPATGGGDGTVPIESAAGLFFGDPRFTFYELQDPGTGEVNHTKLVAHPSTLGSILQILGVDFLLSDLSSGLQEPDYGVITDHFLSLTLDPVEGFVVDGRGRRLGWTTATGPLAEIPGSVWFGEGDGAGWVFGEIEEPLRLELIGVGEPHRVSLTMRNRDRFGGLVDAGMLRTGEAREIDVPMQGEFRNLAAIQLKVPRRVKLSAKRPESRRQVIAIVQNRGNVTETIADADTLAALIDFEVTSLGACPAPELTLAKTPRFPIVLKPGKKLKLKYTLTISCANDGAKSTKTGDHDDFEFSFSVDRAQLDGKRDDFSRDDTCPHGPLGPVPGGRRKLTDRGAGAKTPKGRGGPVRIDVFQQ